MHNILEILKNIKLTDFKVENEIFAHWCILRIISRRKKINLKNIKFDNTIFWVHLSEDISDWEQEGQSSNESSSGNNQNSWSSQNNK